MYMVFFLINWQSIKTTLYPVLLQANHHLTHIPQPTDKEDYRRNLRYLHKARQQSLKLRILSGLKELPNTTSKRTETHVF